MIEDQKRFILNTAFSESYSYYLLAACEVHIKPTSDLECPNSSPHSYIDWNQLEISILLKDSSH